VSARATALLVALGCVWGASFLFIKIVVDQATPLELATGRLALGAVAVIAATAYLRAPVPLGRRVVAQAAVMALLGNVAPFALIAWAQEHIASGLASLLNATMPIFTAVFAAAVLAEERFTPGRAFGLVMGLAGVAALGGRDLLDITETGALGQLAVVAAAASYGAAAVYARTLLRSEDPLGLSALQLVLATPLALALTLAVDRAPGISLDVKGWLSLLALGLLGTGAAYVAYLWLIDNVGSVRASLVTYVIPIVGLLLGWAVLDESIGVNTAVGAALIIAGVASVLRGQAPTTQRAAVPAAEALRMEGEAT
jgi:drug/metabolite transporter (DMT)-like permease